MLTDKARELAQGANYAVVSSVLPSGQPQSHVMWVDTDGTDILINTLEGRQKLKNMEANPLVTVTIISGTDFFDWVEI
ncbi:MAG: PPOX class F420-dependent oxidoreductase, partial [Acidimicrobiia bacterium]|nr:PPOX class F420-dependent oxidoreductase [Acidimicrobiia bacterium]